MKLLLHLLVMLLFSSISYGTVLPAGQASLEYHGYIRSSLGVSEKGSNQVRFQAPGARGRYRLGNEPETNIELQANYTYKMPSPENDNAHIKGIIMLDGFKNQGESNEFSVDHLAQGYLSFNQFFDNDVKLWFGRRYYERKNVYILNHFWLNPGQNSHAAVGIEDLVTGSGKLNVAAFRLEDNFELSSTNYLINSLLLDVRWHSLKLSANTRSTLWGQLASRKSIEALEYAHKTGYSAGFWVDYKSTRLKNTFALIHHTGAAVTQSNVNASPVREDQGWNLDEATVFEINDTMTYEHLPEYSFQWVAVYRLEDRGLSGDKTLSWYSTGARPIFYLNRHLNIALEAGVDYIDDKVNNRKGHLSKLTGALQIAADRGFRSRPVLRFFITLADWSDGLKGSVGHIPGDAPYADNTAGWSVGAQTEAWW